jgi:hypothetical protein
VKAIESESIFVGGPIVGKIYKKFTCILFIMFIISIIIYLNTRLSADAFSLDLKNLSINIIASIIGISMTVYGIDMVARYKTEEEYNRKKKMALRTLHIPVTNHFNILYYMFKASIEIPPSKNYVTIDDLFDDLYYYEVRFLDLESIAPIMRPIDIDWIDYIYEKFTNFKESLSRLVEKYGQFIEVETIDIIERLIDSGFINYMLKLKDLRLIDKSRNWERRPYSISAIIEYGILKQHIDLYLELVKEYNSVVDESHSIKLPTQLWNNNTAPREGSGRIRAKAYSSTSSEVTPL